MHKLVQIVFTIGVACLSAFQLSNGAVRIVDARGKKIYIVEESDLQLTCSSDTGDKVAWSQNGMPVSNLNNSDIIVQTEVKEDEFVSHLTVRNIKRIQTGAYKCANVDFTKAFSSETTETDTVNVYVTSNKALQLTGPELADGHLRFNCTGERETDFEWRFNGQVLNESTHVIVINVLDVNTNVKTSLMTRSYFIEPVHGEYQCSDKSGMKEASPTIVVDLDIVGAALESSSSSSSSRIATSSILLSIVVFSMLGNIFHV